MKTNQLIFLILSVLTFSGCHSLDKVTGYKDDEPSIFDQMYPDPKPFIQSVWIADIHVDGASVPFHFILVDKGNTNIEGIWNLGWYASGQVRANLVGNVFTFALDAGSPCQNAYTGTGTIVGNQMALTMSGPGCLVANPIAPVITLAQGTLLRGGQN